MANDDRSVGSSKSARSKKGGKSIIPKCHCSWKNCRSWQKTFRDCDHKIWNGVVGITWKDSDEKLKKKWSKFLKVEEAKRLGKRYIVARHHFPERLVLQLLGEQDGWDWTELWTKEEAEECYGFLPLAAASEQEGEDLYYKLPLVPKENVKEIVTKVRNDLATRPPLLEGSTLSLPETPPRSASQQDVDSGTFGCKGHVPLTTTWW
jgi:hypothetical protein